MVAVLQLPYSYVLSFVLQSFPAYHQEDHALADHSCYTPIGFSSILVLVLYSLSAEGQWTLSTP